MRKAAKQFLLELIKTLYEAHGVIRKHLHSGAYENARNLLEACQNTAIKLGNSIEASEGEDFISVRYLETYCEALYRVYAKAAEIPSGKAFFLLQKELKRAEKSVKGDIKVRLEIVFLPYKASMWDSLESVWKAADEDPACDAYVVPIPYYDRNPDGSLGTLHYEGQDFPPYVPVVQYESYELEKRRPDAIYIHNPYDQYNSVTSVAPRYYSYELKKYTETLVYIPYYATTGGMSEGQRSCSAYAYADFIVVQVEKYRKFFDAAIPEEKFLPLGSPKFDRVVHLCQNPSAPPLAWKERLAGKKVYFYNTSIGGLLGGTEAFLKKMNYVFDCFKGRSDAVLLWRPHPLLASTLRSLRPQYEEAFLQIKRRFFAEEIGIYDDTSDITATVALCDAYIGDSGTSVTSLFGVAGKPLFILNNWITSRPEEDDWRGQTIRGVCLDEEEGWLVTDANRLYSVDLETMQYQYLCRLSAYTNNEYYANALRIGGKIYVGPYSAQDICVVEGKAVRKIPLKRLSEQNASFAYMVRYKQYLVLVPLHYPALVRYDTSNGEICYFAENTSVFTGDVEGARTAGGSCLRGGTLFLASPINTLVLAFDIATGREQVLTTGAKAACGCMSIADDGTDLWLMPMTGTAITRWNPVTGDVKEYATYPAGFQCVHPVHRFECESRPFSYAYSYSGSILFAPSWANMFIKIEKKSGKITRWAPPFPMVGEAKNGYYFVGAKYTFVMQPYHREPESPICLIYAYLERLFYRVNLVSGEYEKIVPTFDVETLKAHEPGFDRCSEWLQYACNENAFNSLPDFLDGKITGAAFDREKQLEAFAGIIANPDGTCGAKVHQFVTERLKR